MKYIKNIKRWIAAISICVIGVASSICLVGCTWLDQQKCSHDWDNGQVTKEATCKASGERTFTCIKCEKTAVEAIAKLPHNEVEVEWVEPKCGVTGLTESIKCSVCDLVLVEPKVLPALEHEVVVDLAVNATCTKKGYTEGSHCKLCNEVFTAQEEIPATTHDPVLLPSSEATCISPALGPGQGCSKCGKIYVEQEVISPALGHKFVGNKCTVCALELDNDAEVVLEIYGTSNNVVETSMIKGQAYEVGSVIRIYRPQNGPSYDCYDISGKNDIPFLAAYDATEEDPLYTLPFYWSSNVKDDIVSIEGDFAYKAYSNYVDFYIGNFTAICKNGTVTYTLSISGETFTIMPAMATINMDNVKILSLGV